MNLKLIFTVIIILQALFIHVEAQKHPQFRYVSFEAGMNLSGISSAPQFDEHQKNAGFHAGVSGNYSFSDFKSIGASLVFDRKGAVDRVHNINTNLNYVSIPFHMKWIIGKEPRLFLTTGIYVSRLISAKRRGEQNVDGQISAVDENITDEFSPFDIGINLGTGLMIRLYDDIDFMVNVGGGAGLLKISDMPEYSPRNFNLNLSLGYIYFIGYR
ncbi:MAG: outer membrane beta-barrel protein [Bacteroidales bacterium]